MSTKFIINQDRDIIIPFDADTVLYIKPGEMNGVCYDFNIMCRVNAEEEKELMDDVCLGTFNEIWEAAKEVNAIYNCTDDIYAIDGYSVGGFDECLL